MATRITEELEEDLPPERRRAVAERVREMEIEMLLHEMRRQSEITLAEFAKALGAKSHDVPPLQNESDMGLLELHRLVSSLGGRLQVAIELPGKGTFTLSQFDPK